MALIKEPHILLEKIHNHLNKAIDIFEEYENTPIIESDKLWKIRERIENITYELEQEYTLLTTDKI